MFLTFRHFDIVDAIMTNGSINRAAKALGMTQPALTKALQALEFQIGESLFDRQTTPIKPTRFAEVFMKRSSRIAYEKAEILRDIDRLNGLQTGRLIVASGMLAAECSVEAAVGRVVAMYPQLEIQLIQNDWRQITASVQTGAVDLAVIELGLAETLPELATEIVNAQQCGFFCRGGHPLSSQTRVNWGEIGLYPYVGNHLSSRLANQFSQTPANLGAYNSSTGEMAPQILVETFSALKNIVLNSNGIGVTFPALIARECADGDLAMLDVGAPSWMKTRYGFVHLRGRQMSPALTVFMDTVRTIEYEKCGMPDI